MERFGGMRVIVVGGSGGIGSAVVAQFALEGATVLTLDRAEPSWGGQWLPVDLAQPDQIVETMARAAEQLGGVDVVVNTAGILHIADALATSVDDWDRVMAINARGAFVVLREAGRLLRERGGSVVSIASMAGKAGGEEEIAYSASKAAVIAMTRVAALEWGECGIRVNCVCPGYIPTAMGADTRTPEDVARWSALSPLGRLGTPEEVAEVICFLASDEARYLTGQAVNITGGMVMH